MDFPQLVKLPPFLFLQIGLHVVSGSLLMLPLQLSKLGHDFAPQAPLLSQLLLQSADNLHFLKSIKGVLPPILLFLQKHILNLLLFDLLGLPVQFIQVFDHGHKDDVAEGDKIDGCKILKQIAADIDIDFEEDDKAKHIPKQFERQKHNLNNSKNSPLIGVPQQNDQHPHMIDKSEQGRKALNFKPGSKCNFHVERSDIAAL